MANPGKSGADGKKTLEDLPPEQVKILTDWMTEIVAKSTISTIKTAFDELLPKVVDRTMKELGYSEEIAGLVS